MFKCKSGSFTRRLKHIAVVQSFGIEVDSARNEAMVHGRVGEIQTESSAVKVPGHPDG